VGRVAAEVWIALLVPPALLLLAMLLQRLEAAVLADGGSAPHLDADDLTRAAVLNAGGDEPPAGAATAVVG
jgi:hypothetical protein